MLNGVIELTVISTDIYSRGKLSEGYDDRFTQQSVCAILRSKRRSKLQIQTLTGWLGGRRNDFTIWDLLKFSVFLIITKERLCKTYTLR